MDAAPLRISVITPCLNDGACIEPTLCSVLDQDYEPREYLVADGGSIDGTVYALARYDRQIDWWRSEPDRGRSDAIRKALRYSMGDLVVILDAGDVLLPDALVQIAACARRCGADWMIGRAQVMNRKAMTVGHRDRAVHVWSRPLLGTHPLPCDQGLRFERMMTMRLLQSGHRPVPLPCLTMAAQVTGTWRQAA